MRSERPAASAAGGVRAAIRSPREVTPMSAPTTVLPYQPSTMSTAQLATVSYLARYAGANPRPVPLLAAAVVYLVRGKRSGRVSAEVLAAFDAR